MAQWIYVKCSNRYLPLLMLTADPVNAILIRRTLDKAVTINAYSLSDSVIDHSNVMTMFGPKTYDKANWECQVRWYTGAGRKSICLNFIDKIERRQNWKHFNRNWWFFISYNIICTRYMLYKNVRIMYHFNGIVDTNVQIRVYHWWLCSS